MADTMRSIELALRGYRLTTAEILYRIPDHPWLLQTYIWQELDLAPDYPNLRGFLRFWKVNIVGELYSVRVATSQNSFAGSMSRTEYALH